MNLITALVLMTASSVATGEPTDYTTAYDRAMKSEKPLLVLVTAEWCPPCQSLKRNTLPKLLDRKSFHGMHFAQVDFDSETRIARQLIGNRPVPQFILYEKRNGKWSVKHLVGLQSVASVEKFVGNSVVRTANRKVDAKATASK